MFDSLFLRSLAMGPTESAEAFWTSKRDSEELTEAIPVTLFMERIVISLTPSKTLKFEDGKVYEVVQKAV